MYEPTHSLEFGIQDFGPSSVIGGRPELCTGKDRNRRRFRVDEIRRLSDSGAQNSKQERAYRVVEGAGKSDDHLSERDRQEDHGYTTVLLYMAQRNERIGEGRVLWVKADDDQHTTALTGPPGRRSTLVRAEAVPP